MNWKKLGRALVCLILVCCLLINISPIKAEALVAEFSVISVAAGLVIIPVLIGIGIRQGSEGSTAFDNVVSACQDALTAAGYIVDGMMDVYSLTNAQYRYAVDVDLIDWVRNWLFDSGTLTVEQTFPYDDFAGYSAKFHEYYMECMEYSYFFLSYSVTLNRWYAGRSNVSPFVFSYQTHSSTFDVDEYKVNLESGATFKYCAAFSDGTTSSQSSTGIGAMTWWTTSPGYEEEVLSSYDLFLGQVALPSVAFSDGYAEWQRAVDEGDGALPAPPVSLPIQRTEDESKDLTQEEVWDGTATYEDTITDSEAGTDTGTDAGTQTGLLSSILAAIKAIPDAFVSLFDSITTWLSDIWTAITSIPAAIAEAVGALFIPSGNIDAYTMDLTEFFPFCIPFDIFAFLQILKAEPEAPRLEFDIDFPYMDEPWHLVIDLSDWDDVAQLLRTLELILFIVGLAVFTRERYIRG